MNADLRTRKLRHGEIKNSPSVGSWAKPFECMLPSPLSLDNDTQYLWGAYQVQGSLWAEACNSVTGYKVESQFHTPVRPLRSNLC